MKVNRVALQYNSSETMINIMGVNEEKLAILEGDIDVQMGDRYHTMDELYEHRHRLYLALVKIYDNYITPLGSNVRCWKSRLHQDNTMFDGDFILGMSMTKPQFDPDKPPEKWDITYHIPLKYWDLARVVTLPNAPPYDGHTSADVLERLLRL